MVGASPSDVHVEGLKLVYSADYSINIDASTLTLVTPAAAGDVVQWDLLSQDELGRTVGVTIRKVMIAPPPDGTNISFTMTYVDPVTGTVSGQYQPARAVAGLVRRHLAGARHRFRRQSGATPDDERAARRPIPGSGVSGTSPPPRTRRPRRPCRRI